MAKRSRDAASGPLGTVADGNSNVANGAVNDQGSGLGNGVAPAINGVETIDPAAIADPGDSGTAEVKRGRGRPRGSTNKTSPQADLEAVKTFISVFHGIAEIRVPEMKIDDKEVDLLASSLLRAFPKVRSIVNGETMAKIAFAGVVLQVYGTRVVAIGARIKREKAKEEQQPETVVPFPNTNIHPSAQPRN